MTRNKYIFGFFILLSAFILQRCASPGPLSGGEKDIDPPVFLGSEPIKFSKNITPRKITMEFDEFLVLKDLNNNLMISPPLNEDPEIKLKGKKVLIKNPKDLVFDTNTTYTYFFGDAICDLHEENPNKGFEYVFSTGNSLDSLSIRGKILSAQHLLPEEGVIVSLYKKGMNDTIRFDSLPYFVRPYYVARTNKEGEYQLNNLRSDEYLIFAVKDANSNYFFDMPNEEIAFIDSLVIPQKVYDFIPDSIPIDTSNYQLMDSLWKNYATSVIKQPIQLYMFNQDDSIPRLMETKVEENKRIDLFFKFPIRDSIHIKLLNDSLSTPWYKEEFSPNKDTLSLWLTRIPSDSMVIELAIDSIQPDTLKLLVRGKEKKKESSRRSRKKNKKNKKAKDHKDHILKYKANLKSTLAYFNDINIQFETPLKYAHLESFVLYEDSMQTKPRVAFTDSIHRKLKISYNWQQAHKYSLIIPQEACEDIFGLQNDSIIFNFQTTSDDDYGNIKMNIQFEEQPQYPILINLVKGEAEKEKVIQKHTIFSDTVLNINHISEGDYLIKAIVDENNNGKWNTGNYGEKILPEAVFFFQKTLSVKTGWDIEENWNPSSEDRKRPVLIVKKKEDKSKAK
jgi:hypothetical protein